MFLSESLVFQFTIYDHSCVTIFLCNSNSVSICHKKSAQFLFVFILQCLTMDGCIWDSLKIFFHLKSCGISEYLSIYINTNSFLGLNDFLYFKCGKSQIVFLVLELTMTSATKQLVVLTIVLVLRKGNYDMSLSI